AEAEGCAAAEALSETSSVGGPGTNFTPAIHGQMMPMAKPAAAIAPTRPSSGRSWFGFGTSTRTERGLDSATAAALSMRKGGKSKRESTNGLAHVAQPSIAERVAPSKK